MSVDLAGRHVVVTGAGGGLGGAVVAGLHAAGATCHLPVRSAPASLPAGPRVIVTAGVDLADDASVKRFYAALPGLWASVHLAGGFHGGSITGTSRADADAQLAINFTTALLCCREAVRTMRARSPGAGGRILNIGSRATLVPAGGAIAYAASKAAVDALTRSLAKEVAADGILVNAIAPGTIDTPANRAAMPGADPAGWTRPGDLAQLIAWWISPANQVVTGAIVPAFAT